MLSCILLTASVCLTALLGDFILEVTSVAIYRAIVDNLTHGLVGLLSWATVLVRSTDRNIIISGTFEIILSWAIASFVDIDHFIYNHSVDIKAALQLGEKRPVFHCTSLLFVTCLFPYLYSQMSVEAFLNEFEEGIDGDEEEVLTASGVLQILTEAWINEKLCPELLPHKSDYVDVMMEQIAQMEENISKLNVTDLRNLIHRQELERIRYLIRSYLRIRLTKIEKYSLSLFKTNGIMSSQESKYLREYLALSVEPLKSLCDRMPAPTGVLNPKQIEVLPDLETHVFVKSKSDLAEALMVNDVDVVVKEGSQHILPYSTVKEYIKDNRIILI